MNKVILSVLAVTFLSMTAASAEDEFDVNKFSSIQKFYYNLGKNKSKQEFYAKGYSSATKDFKKMLRKYESKIKRLEAGKYLIESSKITYPEVYKTRNGRDGYEIHIDAPVVEREFSSDDLFIVPLVDKSFSFGRSEPQIDYPNRISEEVTDSFSIPSLSNTVSEVPSAPKEIINRVYVDIKHKSSSIKTFLDAYNAEYSVSESGYRVEFKNESEKRDFCTDLTGESSCYGLN